MRPLPPCFKLQPVDKKRHGADLGAVGAAVSRSTGANRVYNPGVVKTGRFPGCQTRRGKLEEARLP
jgi:hypothetical protein